MIRRIFACLRVVHIQLWLILGITVPYAVFEGIVSYITAVEWAAGMEPDKGLHLSILMFPGLLCVVYGIYRGWFFHPLANSGYFAWLQTVPWNSRKRLPLGPLHLVWQDTVILGLIVIPIAWHATYVHALSVYTAIGYALLAFALPYLLWQAIWLRVTGFAVWSFAVAMGCGIIVFLLPSVVWALITAMSCYVLGSRGTRVALERFPWPDRSTDWPARLIAQLWPKSRPVLSWPFTALSTHGSTTMTAAEASALCLLAA